MILRSTFAGLLLITATTAAAQYADDRYGNPGGYDQRGYERGYDEGRQVRSVNDFYAPLARYGRWVNSRWGRAWSPSVERNWRPYTIGRWDDSGGYGRTWQSDEPFGWATYHYGRWGFDDRLGWLWVPDTVWGPGWVAWRDGGTYAGWAPLPPQVSFSFSFGAGAGFNDWGYDRWYQPSWVFVPRDYLYGRSLRGAILPYQRNREWYDRTRGITHYERENGRVVNRSFGFERGGDRRGYDGDRRGYDGDRRADYGRPGYGRPGADPRGDGVRPGDAVSIGGDRPDRGRRDDATRPGYDRSDAASGPQGYRDRNRDGVSDSLQRAPVTDVRRPEWERRRDQAFQPATGAVVPQLPEPQMQTPQPLPQQSREPQFREPQYRQPRFGQQPGQPQLPPGEAQSLRPQFDRGNRFERGEDAGERGGNRGFRGGERSAQPLAAPPAPAMLSAPMGTPMPTPAPMPSMSVPAPMPAPMPAPIAAPTPAVERQRGEGARGGQRGERFQPQQVEE